MREVPVRRHHAVVLQPEASLRNSGDVGPAISPSGHFLAVLESPRSLLIVELEQVEDGPEGLGSQPCALGSKLSIPCGYDLAAFGWCRSPHKGTQAMFVTVQCSASQVLGCF